MLWELAVPVAAFAGIGLLWSLIVLRGGAGG
jgi:hypothetical protein